VQLFLFPITTTTNLYLGDSDNSGHVNQPRIDSTPYLLIIPHTTSNHSRDRANGPPGEGGGFVCFARIEHPVSHVEILVADAMTAIWCRAVCCCEDGARQ